MLDEEKLALLEEKFILIPVCPEQMGGLSTPRLPAEILRNFVIRKDGADLTKEFELGAHEALAFAKRYKAKHALLKANSPSCGNEKIYNGHFEGVLVGGQGLTAKAFENDGIKVYNETQINDLIREA